MRLSPGSASGLCPKSLTGQVHETGHLRNGSDGVLRGSRLLVARADRASDRKSAEQRQDRHRQPERSDAGAMTKAAVLGAVLRQRQAEESGVCLELEQ